MEQLGKFAKSELRRNSLAHASQTRHPECAHQRCAPVHFVDDIWVCIVNKYRHPERNDRGTT